MQRPLPAAIGHSRAFRRPKNAARYLQALGGREQRCSPAGANIKNAITRHQASPINEPATQRSEYVRVCLPVSGGGAPVQ